MAKKVTTIPATLNRFSSAPVFQRTKRKVAGYARVSTGSEEQQTSYENQVEYYTSYINGRDDWELVGIYTDEGITATNTRHRSGFNQMIEDALDGKIDLIITKSVSRFARNTVDSLTTVRKLKERGIEIYFEKENIWTLDAKGELLITIMSSLAQEESRSISENTTWGKRKGFADGKVSVSYSQFLGYNAGFEINEEEADTVRLIYKLFLTGISFYAITKELERRKLKTPAGKDKWYISTVKSILTNEKYKGDALLQKQYTTDFLQKKRKKNNGEIPQYYVEGHHDAIIPPATFDLVQAEIKKRGGRTYSGVSIFASKIKCGECGCWYGTKTWHSTSKYRKVVYQCNKKYKGEKKCSTPHLTEDEIKALFLKALDKLTVAKDEVLENLQMLHEAATATGGLENEQKTVLQEIEELDEKLRSMVGENARLVQDQEEYERRYQTTYSAYEEKLARLDKIEEALQNKAAQGEIIRHVMENLQNLKGKHTVFDEQLWGGLVDSMTVYTKNKVKFTIRGGIEISVE